MSSQMNKEEPVMNNGINVTEYEGIVEAVREDPALANFEFRARNVWDTGGFNQTTIEGFYGAGEEQGIGERRFVVDADEPPVLLGEDEAPNPVEYLLHALTACLTSSIVYKAASRGIAIESIESTLEGDLNALKFLELSDEGRTGYENIRASFRVRSDASASELEEMARFSPVFDVVTNGTPVSLSITKA